MTMRVPTDLCQEGCPVEATPIVLGANEKPPSCIASSRVPFSKVELRPSGLFLSLPPRLVAHLANTLGKRGVQSYHTDLSSLRG